MPTRIKFTTKPRDFGKFHKRLAKEHARAFEAGEKAGARFVLQHLRMRTIALRKVASGALLQGWRSERKRRGLVRFDNAAPHHVFVERGRLPGTLPPVGVIEAWALRKLGRPGLGWPIAVAIKRRGIKPAPIMNAPGFPSRARQIMLRAMQRAKEQATRKAARS